MMQDTLGNEVTGTSPAVLSALNDFVTGFLSFQPQAINVLKLVDDHPDCCLANTYAGILWMFLESPQAPEKAAPYVARALAAKGTEREKLNARVLAAWAADDVPGAIALCEEIGSRWPSDLAMIKLGQTFLFNIGDAPGMLRIALKALPTMEAIPYVHSLIAFGYEQCHLLDQAEAAARRAMEIEPSDPWAHHAIAHVKLTQGRVQEGIRFLEGAAVHWDNLNSFMYTHNWWHLALFYISAGRTEDVLSAYDRHVWTREKGYSQDQVGAASLLARMEFAGIDVGPRWEDVADHVAQRGADTVSPFLTLQYLYALCRGGRGEAETLMTAIAKRAATPAHDQIAWAEVALPAARGIFAHGAGQYDTAISELAIAMPRMAEIGGSHAQRDLFEQIHLDALIKAGRASAAQQVLEMRRSYDPDGVPLNRLLAEVYEKVGLPGEAATAMARTNIARH